MANRDALYYPYLRFRNEEWLKSTLLVFPKIWRMIPDGHHPEDSDLIRKLGAAQLLECTALNSPGVDRAVQKLLGRIKADMANDPHFAHRFSKRNSDQIKARTGDPKGYQLLSFKASLLLSELKELNLAWRPEVSDGQNYLEMHPDLGETIMSTLAAASALDDGLQVVADEAPLHDCLVRNQEDEIYDALIHRRDINVYEADHSKVELLVFQQFDFRELTPENLVKLREEDQALGRFHQKAADIAKSIPTMRNKDRFETELKRKVDEVIDEWDQSKTRPGSIARQIFTGTEKPTGDFLKKIAEQAAGPAVTGAMVGGLSTGTVLGATAGFGVALVVHAATAVRTVATQQKDGPYHILTLLEKSGAAFTAGC